MKYKYLLLLLTFFLLSCKEQTVPQKEFYVDDFKWSITIPENFEHVSNEEWAKFQNKGAEAVEKTFDEKVINQAKTIFVFRSGKMNYFESNYQPFDTATDGDYLESCIAVDNILYETFITQMPGIEIDTARSITTIDNLEFQTTRMTVKYPNKTTLNSIMFSRLFDKKEFSVNIIYVDTQKGNDMLKSWENSKFKK